MTALWVAAAVLFPIWGAHAMVAAVLRNFPRTTAIRIFHLVLAAGIGWGGASCFYFLWLASFGKPQAAYVAVDSLFWFVLAFLFRPSRLTAAMSAPARPAEDVRQHAKLSRLLALTFAGVVAVALAGQVAQTLAEPNGGWDAWSIWNFRARSLFRLGDDWPLALNGVFHHTDYPLLIPATLARCWTFLGDETTWAGALLGITFTLATVAVLTAAVAHRRGAGAGLIAGMALLGTIRFLCCGAWQYADVPLSFFFLCTLVLLTLHEEQFRNRTKSSGAGLLALAGMTTGLAAWTKNEGLMFAAIVLAVVPATAAWRHEWKAGLRQGLAVLTGAVPGLATVLLFKTHVPISNEIVAGQELSATIDRLLDPSRHFKIVLTSLTAGVEVAQLFTAVIPICFLLLGRKRGPESGTAGWVQPAGIIGLMGVGYYGVFLTTPYPLDWHLATSVNRLIVQLWPMILFTIFLQLRTPEEVLAGASWPAEAQSSPPPAAFADLRRAA